MKCPRQPGKKTVQSTADTLTHPEGFFHTKGKKTSQEDDYFSSIGNTYSASDNPDEYARYLDKQAEKQRREQEKEQARLLKEQQDRQAALQRDTLQKLNQLAMTSPVVIDNNDPAPAFKTDPDDPPGGVPETKRRNILLNKYDTHHRQPTDYFGQQLRIDGRVNPGHRYADSCGYPGQNRGKPRGRISHVRHTAWIDECHAVAVEREHSIQWGKGNDGLCRFHDFRYYRYCSRTIFSLSFRKSPKSHLKRTCFLFRLAKSRERVSSLILKGSLPFL